MGNHHLTPLTTTDTGDSMPLIPPDFGYRKLAGRDAGLGYLSCCTAPVAKSKRTSCAPGVADPLAVDSPQR